MMKQGNPDHPRLAIHFRLDPSRGWAFGRFDWSIQISENTPWGAIFVHGRHRMNRHLRGRGPEQSNNKTRRASSAGLHPFLCGLEKLLHRLTPGLPPRVLFSAPFTFLSAHRESGTRVASEEAEFLCAVLA